MTEATQRPLAGAWWQDPNDNRIHDAEGNDVLDHMTVTEIGRRVNNHDALVAALNDALHIVHVSSDATDLHDALKDWAHSVEVEVK